MADFVAPGKVKSNTVGSFVAPGKVKSSPSKTSEPPAKNDPPKNLIIPDDYFTPEMIDSLAKVQKITDAKKIQAAKDKLLSENRLRGTAQEADYWNRLSTARKAQETDPNAIFVSPVSVPYDTGDTRASTAKNVAKGLLDILDLPSRAIAAGLTKQKMSEPGAYAAKPIVDELLSEGKTSYGLEKAPLSKAERVTTELAGRFISDPLNVLNPIKGAVIKGVKVASSPVKSLKNIGKTNLSKTILDILNPSSLTKEIGKKGLKSQLGIKAKDAENYARIVGLDKELLPSIAGRQAMVDDIVKEGITSPLGYQRMMELADDKLKAAMVSKKSALPSKNVSDVLTEADVITTNTPIGYEVSSRVDEVLDADRIDLNKVFTDLKSNVSKDKTILPENRELLQTQINKLQELYTDPTKTRIATRGLIDIKNAEKIRKMLSQGSYKTPFIGDHPVKAQAKELAERAVSDAILKVRPFVVADNLNIRKMQSIKDVIDRAAEAYDKGNVLDRLASGEIVGSAVGSLAPITSRLPSTLLLTDYLNRVTGGSLPRNVATGFLNDERTKQDAKRRALEKAKSDTLGGK